MSSLPNIGSKRMVVGAHYGFADWLAQRLTAVVIGLYTIIVLVAFFSAKDYSYNGWAGLFAAQWMKIATFVALIAIFYHAWVGIRDIWMDYIQPTAIRLTLEALTILWLVGCAGYAAQILWRA